MTNPPAEPTSARRRGVWRRFGRGPVVAAAAIAALIAIGATGNVGQTYALWSDTTTAQPQVATAASVAATASGKTATVSFSAGVLTRMDTATITNTGTVTADYKTTTKVTNPSPTTFASRLKVQVWRTTTAGVCNLPANTASYAWGADPLLTGTLAAKTSVHYCALTTLSTAADLLTSGTVNASLETTLTRGSWSSTVSSPMTQTFTDAPPSAPSGLTSTGTTAFSVKLNWTASTDTFGVAGYEVLRGQSLIGTSSATTFTDPMTASPSSAYNYTVRAFDGAGNRSAATPITVTTPAATIPTGRLQIANTNSGLCVNASAVWSQTLDQQICASTANQSWGATGPDPAGFYTIVSRLSSALVWDVTGVSTADNAVVGLYQPNQQTNQQWRVVAVGPDRYQFVARHSNKCLSVAGSSKTAGALYNQQTCNTANLAQTFSLRSVPEPLPAAPTNLTVSATTSTSVSLKWSAPTDATGITSYVVYRNGTPLTNEPTATSFVDTGRTTGTQYTYTVRAKNASGQSDPSNSVSARPSTLACTSYDSWYLEYRWTVPATEVIRYDSYLNGILIPTPQPQTWTPPSAGWPVLQLKGENVPTNLTGTVSVEVRQVLRNGSTVSMGIGYLRVGPSSAPYNCG